MQDSKGELKESLTSVQYYTDLKSNFLLNNLATLKKKLFRTNQAPYITKELRKQLWKDHTKQKFCF